MNYISDCLYLGCVDDAYDVESLKKHEIKSILTIDAKPLRLEVTEGLNYKYVHAFDMEEEDLLADIQDSLDFIKHSITSGGVFVHCHAGRSRSATIVIAYLMQKFDMSLNDTTTMVMKQRNISPNDGFLFQLKLFEEMGNKIDPSRSEYKVYKLGILSKKIQSALEPSGLIDSLSEDPLNSVTSAHDKAFFKCGKCRRPLFKKTAVLPHNKGIGDAAFHWHKSRLQGEASAMELCPTSLFIEPIQWMEKDIYELKGKINCPKCAAKLGSFNWSGERCPCGTWITPAFHVHLSKVDEVSPRRLIQMPNRQTHQIAATDTGESLPS